MRCSSHAEISLIISAVKNVSATKPSWWYGSMTYRLIVRRHLAILEAS